MCIFSAREIVVCLYGVLFVIYILLHKKLRESFGKVIKSACTIKLFIPFVLILCYSSVFVYFCTYAKLWKWIYLKDIIIWTLIVGVPVCFNAVSSKIEDNYFTNIIVDNLKFTALVQFFFRKIYI